MRLAGAHPKGVSRRSAQCTIGLWLEAASGRKRNTTPLGVRPLTRSEKEPKITSGKRLQFFEARRLMIFLPHRAGRHAATSTSRALAVRWRRGRRPVWLAAVCALFASGLVVPQDPSGAEDDVRAKLLPVRIKGHVTDGLSKSLQEEVERRLRQEPGITHVIVEIDSAGADSEAAVELAEYLFGRLKSVRTTAFLERGAQATALTALIALACNEIVMGEESHLGAPRESARAGDAAPADGILRLARKYAASRNYPVALASALFTPAQSDVLHVRTAEFRGGKDVETHRFVTPEDLQDLRARKIRVVGEARVVVAKGTTLTIGARDALTFGVARHIVNDFDELRVALDLADAQVVDPSHAAFKPESPEAQSVIDFLNHPFVRFLLIMGGCLGLLLEFKMFGTMIPAACGALCFIVFFVAACFPVSGAEQASATIYEVLLFVVGLGLIGLELAFPGVAIFALLGVALCGLSIILAMISGGLTEEGGLERFQEALFVFFGSFGVGVMLFMALLWYLSTSSAFRKRGLVTETAIVGVPTADSALESQSDTAELVGCTGSAVTTLRPAGKIELEDGRQLDVVSDGQYIEKGQMVRIVESIGANVVVAAVEGSPETTE